MNHVLSPKDQFQKFHEKEHEEWKRIAAGRVAQMAFNYALAEMSALSFGSGGYSIEAIKGANAFIYIALNLGEVEVPVADKFPAQPLIEETDKLKI